MSELWKTAAKCYDDMLENRRILLNDPMDIDAADRFLDAAIVLADLQLPNPFADLDGMTFTMNAAVRPSASERTITGVKE